MNGYNQYFESYVTDGTIYDLYFIKFDELMQDDSWSPNVKQDETVIIAIPVALSSAFATILEVYLDDVTDESATAITTTTTTSTTSTTTTSTTQAIP